MTLRQFSIQTSDLGHPEEGDSVEGSDAFSVAHKVAAAYQLSIYWDRGCPLMTAQVCTVVDDMIGSNSGLERDYYLSSFRLLNDDFSESGFVHERLYRETEHNYFLNPISPSLQLSLFRETLPLEKNSKGKNPSEQVVIPPSSAVLTMPPTQIVLSRLILEDAAYLRKCFALWSQTRRNQLPDRAVTHLTKIRPISSPLSDPRSWWKYALEATVTILQSSKPLHQKRKLGWLSLVRALSSQKKYGRLYHQLMTSRDEQERRRIHQELVENRRWP